MTPLREKETARNICRCQRGSSAASHPSYLSPRTGASCLAVRHTICAGQTSGVVYFSDKADPIWSRTDRCCGCYGRLSLEDVITATSRRHLLLAYLMLRSERVGEKGGNTRGSTVDGWTDSFTCISRLPSQWPPHSGRYSPIPGTFIFCRAICIYTVSLVSIVCQTK